MKFPFTRDEIAAYFGCCRKRGDLGLLGISVSYLANELMQEVKEANLDTSSRIYELEDLQDVDNNGLIRRKGADVECPIDGKKGAAYVHSIHDPDAVGTAEIMLSYAWGYTIGDIVDTLKEYCKKISKDPKDVYVWICCFCVNQHRVIELKKEGKDIPFEDFRKVFNDRVTRIGHIVTMMAPWDAPVYLTRIWCVFEIYTANKTGSKVTIAMPSSERKRFIDGLRSEDGQSQIDTLFSTLGKTDVKKAEASVESDRTSILRIIEDGVGYGGFNNTVSGLLKDWAISLIIAEVEEGGLDLEDDSSKKLQAELLCNVADLFYKMALYVYDGLQLGARGSTMAKEALLINEGLYGRKSVHTAKSILLVGLGLWCYNKYDKALKLFQESLEIFDSNHGRNHRDTAESLYRIGYTLRSKGNNKKALKPLREALSIKENLFGKEDKETTETRHEIAVILKKSEVDEKLELHELNLRIRKKFLGIEHVDTAHSMCHIGYIYYKKGDFEKALELYKAALVIREKVYGSDDPQTKQCRKDVDGVTSAIKKNRPNHK